MKKAVTKSVRPPNGAPDTLTGAAAEHVPASETQSRPRPRGSGPPGRGLGPGWGAGARVFSLGFGLLPNNVEPDNLFWILKNKTKQTPKLKVPSDRAEESDPRHVEIKQRAGRSRRHSAGERGSLGGGAPGRGLGSPAGAFWDQGHPRPRPAAEADTGGSPHTCRPSVA